MAKIGKIGIYLPERIVTNDDLQKEFPQADFESFEKTVGVRSRHIAAPNETALDLAEKAVTNVFEKGGNSNIDFILFGTQTPDYHLPGNAGILQNRLGLDKNMGALDYNLGCSSYIYGLALAKGLIDSGLANRILLVISDTFTKYVHPKDRINRALLGDGATATIIENSNDGIGEFILGTDGSGFDNLIVPNGGAKNPINPEAEEFEYGTGNITDDNHFFMNGLEIFSFSAKIVPKLVQDTLDKNQLEINDIDHFVFHQANGYMLKFLRKKINISESKFHTNIESIGNTSGSSIPILLKESIDNRQIKPGQKVLLVGYGVGLSWGGVVINT